MNSIVADEFLRWYGETLPWTTQEAIAIDVWAAYVRYRDSVQAR